MADQLNYLRLKFSIQKDIFYGIIVTAIILLIKYKIHHLIFFKQLIVITFATLPTCLSWYFPLFNYILQFLSLLFPYFVEITFNM